MASSATRTTAVRTTKVSTTRRQTTDWSSRGTLSGITLGTLNLGATFKCIDVELQFTEPSGTIARAYAEVRALSAAATVTTTIDLMLVRPTSEQFAAYGVCFDRAAGTTYDVRVTVIDALGNRAVKSGTVATRADTIADLSTLVATRFVRADGSDANAGTADSAGGAWLTLDFAWLNAPAGAVVQVGPGVFQKTPDSSAAGSQRTSTTNGVTFVAQYPALDAGRNRINAGNETWVVQPNTYRTSPTGSGGPNAGVWTATTLSGPGNNGNTPGASYAVWTWASGLATNQPGIAQVSATQLGTLTQICPWKRDASHLASAAGWAEKLYTNLTYRYGWWIDTSGNIYLRLPNDVDPNTVWLSFAPTSGNIGAYGAFVWKAPDVRFSGLVFRGFACGLFAGSTTALRAITDRCQFESCTLGFGTGSGSDPSSATAGSFADNAVVQDSVFFDRGLRMPAGGVPDATIIGWNIIKSTVVNADGTSYATTKIAATLEGSAVGGRRVGRRCVVRRCTVDGTHNGITQGTNSTTPRWAGYAMETHDCLVKNTQDDAFEPEGPVVNLKIYDCRTEWTLTGVSIAPHTYGPLYVFRCQFWRWGADGMGRMLSTGKPMVTGVAIKFGGNSAPAGRLYLLHCTGWTDSLITTIDPGTGVVTITRASGPDESAGSSSANAAIWTYNSIFRATNYPYVHPRLNAAISVVRDEDYNLVAGVTFDGTLSPPQPLGGMRTNGGSDFAIYTSRGGDATHSTYPADGVAEYRAAKRMGAHTNLVGGSDQVFTPPTWLDALLTDPANGDLSLVSGAAVVGTPIAGLSDALGRTVKIGYQP